MTEVEASAAAVKEEEEKDEEESVYSDPNGKIWFSAMFWLSWAMESFCNLQSP